MASSKLIKFFKILTVMTFGLSIALPIYSLYRLPLKETNKNVGKATFQLITSIGDRKKMEAITNKSELRQHIIGLRNYIYYLLYERKIQNYTLHQGRWLYWDVDDYRYQRKYNTVPLAHVEKLAQFFKAQRIPWIVLGIPAKPYIYPEKAGAKVIKDSGDNKRFLETIQNNPDIRYIDAYGIFRKFREKYLLYNGVEHHPNNIGNYLAFSLLTGELNAIYKKEAPVLDEDDIVEATYKTINSRDSFDEFGKVPNNIISVLEMRPYGIEYPYGYVTVRDAFLDKKVDIYNFVTGELLMKTNPRRKFDRDL